MKILGQPFPTQALWVLPIVQAVLGSEAVFYVSAFVALLNLLQWTYGVFVITKDKRQVSVRKIITNPILISMIIGICLFLIPVEIPHVISETVSLVAGMNAPVAMISLGTYLAQITAAQLVRDKAAWLSTLVRLLVIPAGDIGCINIHPGKLRIPENGHPYCGRHPGWLQCGYICTDPQ